MTAAVHDQHLAQAVDHLRAAIDGNKPLLDGAQGLRSLINRLVLDPPIDPQSVGEMSQLLFAVAPRIADAAAGRIAPEHIFTALGCGSAAMTCRDAPRYLDLIAYVAVLEAEIRALYLRDMIAAGSQADLVDTLDRNPVIAVPYVTGPQTVQ